MKLQRRPYFGPFDEPVRCHSWVGWWHLWSSQPGEEEGHWRTGCHQKVNNKQVETSARLGVGVKGTAYLIYSWQLHLCTYIGYKWWQGCNANFSSPQFYFYRLCLFVMTYRTLYKQSHLPTESVAATHCVNTQCLVTHCSVTVFCVCLHLHCCFQIQAKVLLLAGSDGFARSEGESPYIINLLESARFCAGQITNKSYGSWIRTEEMVLTNPWSRTRVLPTAQALIT